MPKEKGYWRFKTKKEMIDSNDYGRNWNEDGHMDYLYGTYLPEDLEIFADENISFFIPNTNPDYHKDKWRIFPSHLIKVLDKVATKKSMKEKSLQEVFDTTSEKQYEEVPVFDIDRLAKEIDDIFQGQLSESEAKFEGIIGPIKENKLNEFESNLENKLDTYSKEVDKIFPAIREKLFEEFTKGRTTLVLPDKTEITVEHMDHPELGSVIKSLHLQRKAMLVGPAGTGKTYMIGQVADRLKLPFYKYSCSRDSSVHDLLGYKQPKSETYLETSFLNAYENGGIFLVDEYDAMSGDMALFFNGVADSSKFISIPHRDTKPQAVKHPDFYLVMCGNTWGKGSTDYSGRDFQDLALMDRFRFCRHHIGYHIDLEKSLMGTDYPFALYLREALEEIGSYLSTRNIEDISKLVASGVEFKLIVDMLTQDLTDEERKRVTTKVKKFTGAVKGTDPNKIIIEYKGSEHTLAKLMDLYPPKNESKLLNLKKSHPLLFAEYRYALSGQGIDINI